MQLISGFLETADQMVIMTFDLGNSAFLNDTIDVVDRCCRKFIGDNFTENTNISKMSNYSTTTNLIIVTNGDLPL